MQSVISARSRNKASVAVEQMMRKTIREECFAALHIEPHTLAHQDLLRSTRKYR